MKDQAETTAERKEGRGVWTYVYWVGGILVLYVLSTGPYVLMFHKGVMDRHPKFSAVLVYAYRPLLWADRNTPLGVPLEMYMDLWRPKLLNKMWDDPVIR
jgi:hypothetical protein